MFAEPRDLSGWVASGLYVFDPDQPNQHLAYSGQPTCENQKSQASLTPFSARPPEHAGDTDPL